MFILALASSNKTININNYFYYVKRRFYYKCSLFLDLLMKNIFVEIFESIISKGHISTKYVGII